MHGRYYVVAGCANYYVRYSISTPSSLGHLMAVSEDMEKILRKKKNGGVGCQTRLFHHDNLEYRVTDSAHKARTSGKELGDGLHHKLWVQHCKPQVWSTIGVSHTARNVPNASLFIPFFFFKLGRVQTSCHWFAWNVKWLCALATKLSTEEHQWRETKHSRYGSSMKANTQPW